MEIKLIMLDLDGTLLNSDKQISEENYRALEEAAQKGVYIVPSTGRFYKAVPDAIRDMPFVRYINTMNGAKLYDCKENQVLYLAEIDRDTADSVFAYLEKLPVLYDCYQNDWGWMKRDFFLIADQYVFDPHVLKLVYTIRKPLDDFRTEVYNRESGVQKIMVFFKDEELRVHVQEDLKKKYTNLSITSSIPNDIEINSKDANKGQVLQFLCQHLHIDIEQTMAFGDSGNDMSMIKAAGLGVAMANADKELLSCADYVTDSNNENGVAKAIRKYVL